MKLLQNTVVAALGLAAQTVSLSTFTPISGGPTYKVGIPSGSGISSSSTGPIYFSISAPSSYQWIGLGIGTAMKGATIFQMFADGTGNVTLSARDGGAGEVEPQHDTALQAGVTLLAGSGDDGTTMTANVRCTTCKLNSGDATSTTSPWICSWMTGDPINSKDLSFNLVMHGPTSMRAFDFDLSKASISSDENPFVEAAASTTSSGASPSSTSSSGSGTGVGSVSLGTGAGNLISYEKAHGIIMGATVVLLFPIGAIFMRLVGSPLLHGLLQVFALLALIVGFGLGIKLAMMMDYLYKGPGQTHTVFGTVIIGLFLIQPILGLWHHHSYKKHQKRSGVSHTHIWFGRSIMILAVVNGGLGLKLAANTKNGEIAYGVVAGVIALLYALVVVFKRKKTETRWMWKKEGREAEIANRT